MTMSGKLPNAGRNCPGSLSSRYVRVACTSSSCNLASWRLGIYVFCHDLQQDGHRPPAARAAPGGLHRRRSVLLLRRGAQPDRSGEDSPRRDVPRGRRVQLGLRVRHPDGAQGSRPARLRRQRRLAGGGGGGRDPLQLRLAPHGAARRARRLRPDRPRTVPHPHSRALSGGGRPAQPMVLASTCSGAAGISTTNLAPPSSESSSQILPPTSVTTRWQIASPRPVPSSGPLVVKNGSKMRARISRGTPGPESSTVRRTQPSRDCVVSRMMAGLRPRTTCSALVTRLITTCCSS